MSGAGPPLIFIAGYDQDLSYLMESQLNFVTASIAKGGRHVLRA